MKVTHLYKGLLASQETVKSISSCTVTERTFHDNSELDNRKIIRFKINKLGITDTLD